MAARDRGAGTGRGALADLVGLPAIDLSIDHARGDRFVRVRGQRSGSDLARACSAAAAAGPHVFGAAFPVFILLSLAVQAVFVFLRRDYHAAWWRVACVYAVMMLFLDPVLVAPLTGAITPRDAPAHGRVQHPAGERTSTVALLAVVHRREPASPDRPAGDAAYSDAIIALRGTAIRRPGSGIREALIDLRLGPGTTDPGPRITHPDIFSRGHMKSLIAAVLLLVSSVAAFAADRVKTANGTVEGTTEPSGIRVYQGHPVRRAAGRGAAMEGAAAGQELGRASEATTQFGPRCMQASLFGDMVFRSNGMSEDCLYLNVWTPAKSGNERLPVLVYFFGGGFVAGDGSEPRYDGESMAKKGIVALTVNYRLGVFGFFAHPELTKESPHHASGNYALLDQNAALKWVQQNIEAFGGDPRRGDDRGRVGRIDCGQRADGVAVVEGTHRRRDRRERRAHCADAPAGPLAQGEQEGVKFAASMRRDHARCPARDAGRSRSQEAAAKLPIGRFASTVDGYVLPKSPVEIFAAGEQAHVPLLAGWNTEENSAARFWPPDEPTPENFTKALGTLYGDRAGEAAKVYAGSTNDEVRQAATDLASDRFIAYSTWKWIDLHSRTGAKPVYRYLYARGRGRQMTRRRAGGAAHSSSRAARGAVHSAEIEYAMGNLATNKVYAWSADDYKVSKIMQELLREFREDGKPQRPGTAAMAGREQRRLTIHAHRCRHACRAR